MKKEKYVRILMILSLLIVATSVVNFVFNLNNSRDLEPIFLAILPIFFEVLVYYYFKQRINISRFYFWFSGLMFIVGLLYFIFAKFDLYFLNLYIKSVLYLISFVVLLFGKEELTNSELKLVKKANRILGISWFLSITLFTNVSRSYTEAKIKRYNNELKTHNNKESSKSFLESLQDLALQINKTTPNYIDEMTRLDSAYANQVDTSFFFYYTLIKTSKQKINVKKFEKIMYKSLHDRALTDSQTNIMIENNVKMNYIYFDKDGNLLTKIQISNKDL